MKDKLFSNLLIKVLEKKLTRFFLFNLLYIPISLFGFLFFKSVNFIVTYFMIQNGIWKLLVYFSVKISMSYNDTVGQKIKKIPGKKNSWNQINKTFFSWNCIFGSFFPVPKLIFGHFWNCKKMEFGQKKNS